MDPAKIHSASTERVLLGCLLMAANRPDVRAGIFGTVRRDWFYIEHHRMIWDAMTHTEKEGGSFDISAISRALRDFGTIDQVGAHNVSLLAVEVPTFLIWEFHADKLKEDYDRRRMTAAIDKARGGMVKTPQESAAQLVAEVNDALADADAQTVFTCKEAARAMVDMLQEAQRRRDAGGLVGWQTSDDKLTEVMPLLPGQMLVIGMRSGGGKTSVACNGAQFTAAAGEPFAFHSVEMPVSELQLRMTSRVVDIQELELLKGSGSGRDFGHLSQYAAHVASNPLFVTKPVSTIEDVERKVRHMYAVHGVRYQAVDYFQLLRSVERFGSRADELNYIGQRLKRLTVDLPGLGLCVLAQLNKSWQRADPSKEDIRFGSGLCDSADAVCLGWRPRKGEDDDDEIRFRLDKGRFGGEGEIACRWIHGRILAGFTSYDQEMDRRFKACSSGES
jgi:replicative DNA helicase